MRTIVFLASHLGDNYRHLTIIKAIESVAKNTVKPHLWVSYSYESEAPNIEEWSSITEGIETCFYDRGKGRIPQFEHIKFLSQNIKQDDIIMFLDDDDLYSENRVEIIESVFKKYPEIKIINSRSLIFGDPFTINIEEKPDLEKINIHINEYTNFCIKGSILLSYFESLCHNVHMVNFNKDYEDLVFIVFVKDRLDIVIDDILYYKRSGLPKHYTPYKNKI